MNLLITLIALSFFAIGGVLWYASAQGYIESETLDRLDKIASIMAFTSGVIFFVSQFIPGDPTFDYSVRVLSLATAQEIPHAEVVIEVVGRPNLDGVTDTNGLVTISIPASHAGKRGRLIVKAKGYQRHFEEISLDQGLLPKIVQLQISPTEQIEQLQETPLPIFTPERTPSLSVQPTEIASEASGIEATANSTDPTSTPSIDASTVSTPTVESGGQLTPQGGPSSLLKIIILDDFMKNLSDSSRLTLLTGVGVATTFFGLWFFSHMRGNGRYDTDIVVHAISFIVFIICPVVGFWLHGGWGIVGGLFVGTIMLLLFSIVASDVFPRIVWGLIGTVVGMSLGSGVFFALPCIS